MKKMLTVQLITTKPNRITREEFEEISDDLKNQIDRIRFDNSAAAFVDVRIGQMGK
jgi:hypothetical protein